MCRHLFHISRLFTCLTRAGGVKVWEFDANASVETCPYINERCMAENWTRSQIDTRCMVRPSESLIALVGVRRKEPNMFFALNFVCFFSRQDWTCYTLELQMARCDLSYFRLAERFRGLKIDNTTPRNPWALQVSRWTFVYPQLGMRQDKGRKWFRHEQLSSFFPNSNGFAAFSHRAHSKGFGAELLSDSMVLWGRSVKVPPKRFQQGSAKDPPKVSTKVCNFRDLSGSSGQIPASLLCICLWVPSTLCIFP